MKLKSPLKVKSPTLVFMGSPDFALPSLESVYRFADAHGGKVVGIFSQPDRPKGRGQKLTPCAVAARARQKGTPLFQPQVLKKGEEAEKVLAFLNQADPDFIVVVAYGRILPKAILDLPRLGCVNVHSSLLPAYRGAAPIQWAMARGEVITGITTMHMDEGLDTGPILLQKECEIGKNEYADTLHDRLAKMGAEVLTETLEGLFAGTLYSRSQPAEGVSYAPRIQKSDGRIDWSKSAQEIVNRIRGFYPWPGSTSQFEGSTVKIHRAHCQRPKMNGAKKKAAYPPGTVISVESEGISVQTGDNNTVVITEIQIAGAKRQKVDDFLRGHRIKVGDVF